jgi:hypothetical protein
VWWRDALADAAIITGCVVAVLKVLEWLVREPTKRKIRDATEQVYVWLSDMTWHSTSTGVMVVGTLGGMCWLMYDLSTSQSLFSSGETIDFPVPWIDNTTGFLHSFLWVVYSIAAFGSFALSFWLAWRMFKLVFPEDDRPTKKLRPSIVLALMYVVGLFQYFADYRERFDWLNRFWLTPILMGFAVASLAVFVIMSFLLVVQGALMLLTLLVLATVRVLQFIVLRIAEGKDGPIMALSGLLIAIGAISKIVAGE